MTFAAPPDTVEWATWGYPYSFMMKYQRSVNDTALLHGDFETYYAGNLVIKGRFNNRKKDGLWEHFDPRTGTKTSAGYYRGGFRNGRWEFFTIDGFRKATKDYASGMPVGMHTSYFNNGAPRLELALRNDTALTSLTLFYPWGDTLLTRGCVYGGDSALCTHRSYYRKGPRHEVYTFITHRHNETVETLLRWGHDYLADVFMLDPTHDTFLAGELTRMHGSYRRYHPTGRLWEQHYYESGRLINVLATYSRWGRIKFGGSFYEGTGTVVRYSSKGDTARVETFVHGVRHGPARYYEPRNRKRAEGFYLNGQPAARWSLRGPDQSLRGFIRFETPDSAVSEGLRKAYTPRHIGAYVNGLRQGKWVFFDYYGDTLSVEHYDRGILHGPYRLYTTGALERSGRYRDGVPDGEWLTYNRSRKVTYRMDYEALSAAQSEYEPAHRLELNFPIYTRFQPRAKVVDAELLPEIAFMPWEGVVEGRRMQMRAIAGRADGDVIFAVDVEDTGHITGIRSLKSSHPEFYNAAAGFVGVMPYMIPASFEGLPRHSRRLVSFYFDELR